MLAVLGLHAIKDKPVAVNGKVEIRPVRKYCRAMLFIELCADITFLAPDDVSRAHV